MALVCEQQLYISYIHFPHFFIPTNLCCKWKRHPDPAIIMFEYCLCQLVQDFLYQHWLVVSNMFDFHSYLGR